VINCTEIGTADIHNNARLKPSLDHPRPFAASVVSQEKYHAVPRVVVFQG
jgi:hypothetical protein